MGFTFCLPLSRRPLLAWPPCAPRQVGRRCQGRAWRSSCLSLRALLEQPPSGSGSGLCGAAHGKLVGMALPEGICDLRIVYCCGSTAPCGFSCCAATLVRLKIWQQTGLANKVQNVTSASGKLPKTEFSGILKATLSGPQAFPRWKFLAASAFGHSAGFSARSGVGGIGANLSGKEKAQKNCSP